MIENLEQNKFRFYRAKVVDNKDPENYGRVKVWIPDLMVDLPEDQGLWARPANCPFGAGNTELNDGRKHAGSSYIPSVGHWVWVFFENDNPNLPYYVSALYIENQPILPENTVGSEPWNKWVILRSPCGRAIVVSDDPDDARVMITGKKNAYDPNNPQNSVKKIRNNQIVIMIDERGPQDQKNQDNVLIADYNGNYIQVRTFENKIYVYATDQNGQPGEICLFTDKAVVRVDNSGSSSVEVSNPGGCIVLDGDGNINIDAKKNVYINAGQKIVLSAPQIHENCGDGKLSSPKPIPPARVQE